MNLRALDAWGWTFFVVGVVMLANALWMLAGPMHWYTELPAAVPDTGPFNPHFVRDIGCAFFSVGIALIWAAKYAITPHSIATEISNRVVSLPYRAATTSGNETESRASASNRSRFPNR